MLLPRSDDQPIFVDDTLRKRRLTLVAGTMAGLALALAALTLVSGFTSTGNRQLPAWPDAASPCQECASATPGPISGAAAASGTSDGPSTPGTTASASGSGHRPHTTDQPTAPALRRTGTRW